VGDGEDAVKSNGGNFIVRLQYRLAQGAVGASTLRGQGGPGIVKTARNYLARMKLKRFSVPAEAQFRVELDEAANSLKEKFSPIPRGKRKGELSWGGARKVVNIFLRDVFYNADLRDRLSLNGIRSWLELPLDSHVALGLQGDLGGISLTEWPGIKCLTPEINDEYQQAATWVAKERQVSRVDLDVFYWRAASYSQDNEC
jgi:hypothetical protein